MTAERFQQTLRVVRMVAEPFRHQQGRNGGSPAAFKGSPKSWVATATKRAAACQLWDRRRLIIDSTWDRPNRVMFRLQSMNTGGMRRSVCACWASANSI